MVVGSHSISTDIVGSKCSMDMASNPSALPSKKILVSHSELQGAWEPTSSLEACGIGASKSSLCHVLS